MGTRKTPHQNWHASKNCPYGPCGQATRQRACQRRELVAHPLACWGTARLLLQRGDLMIRHRWQAGLGGRVPAALCTAPQYPMPATRPAAQEGTAGAASLSAAAGLHACSCREGSQLTIRTPHSSRLGGRACRLQHAQHTPTHQPLAPLRPLPPASSLPARTPLAAPAATRGCVPRGDLVHFYSASGSPAAGQPGLAQTTMPCCSRKYVV